MPSAPIDRWLKGLEDLRELDPDELQSRLVSLRGEIELLRLKVGMLEQLHAEAQRRAKQTQLRTAGDARARVTDEAPASDSPGKDRPTTWKRDAILELLRRHPDETFRPKEIRQMLQDTGVMDGDAGTPTPLLLRRMAERGQVANVDRRYGYKPDEVSPYQGSFETRNGEP